MISVVIGSNDDVRTVQVWSRAAGVSRTQLTVGCRQAGLSAKASLDFARLLRAVLLGSTNHLPFTDFLDVGDPRTLDALLARVGARHLDPRTPVDRFLDQQRQLPAASPLIGAIRTSLALM
jgi:hypothetical protein